MTVAPKEIAKIIESKDLRARQRERLQDIVPLKGPMMVYIDPTNLCNFKCQYCPTADKPLLKQVGRPDGMMPMELYKKIIDDLGNFPEKVRLLSLYKDGEPTLHKDLAEMVAIAKRAGVAERIWTKTNGTKLRPELNRKLVEAGLDMLCVSISAVDVPMYRKIVGVSANYDGIIAGVRDFFENRGNTEIYVKIAESPQLTKKMIEKFFSDFTSISNFIAVEKLMGWSYSDLKDWTLGTNPTTYDGLPFVEKVACPLPFYSMAINWNGDISMCANDWAMKTVIGNAGEKSLTDIWNSKEADDFRLMHLEGRRKENPACAQCFYQKILPDNIDDHRETMAKKFISKLSKSADMQ